MISGSGNVTWGSNVNKVSTHSTHPLKYIQQLSLLRKLHPVAQGNCVCMCARVCWRQKNNEVNHENNVAGERAFNDGDDEEVCVLDKNVFQ